MEEYPHKRLLIAVLLTFTTICVAGGIFFYVTLTHKAPAPQTFMQNTDAARNLYNTGHFTDAIALYQSLIDTAPTKDKEALMKTLLAIVFARRGNAGDQEEAIRLCLSVLNDYRYPPLRRSFALIVIGDMNLSDPQYIQEHLAQEPFLSLLPAPGKPFIQAVYTRGIYEKADELYPNSEAKMKEVKFFTGGFINGKLSISEQKTTATRIQELITESDAERKEIPYEPADLSEQYLYKALGLRVIAQVLDNPPTLEEREQAHMQAITEALRDTSLHAQDSLSLARFFYANFLLRETKNREAEAKQQLDLIASSPQGAEGFPNFVKTFIRINAAGAGVVDELAKTSPSFKTYLTNAGVL